MQSWVWVLVIDALYMIIGALYNLASPRNTSESVR
jgi:hypothetical protein